MQRYNAAKRAPRKENKDNNSSARPKSGWGTLSGNTAPGQHEVKVAKHVLQEQQDQQRSCHECGKMFSNHRGLQHHRENAHGNQKQGGPRQSKLSAGTLDDELLPSRHKNKGLAGRKPKNTTCFTPSHAPPAVRVLCGAPTGSYPRIHGTRDVVLVPEFFCKELDNSLYLALLKELKDSGKEEDGLWALWHGDTHVIANDQKHWKKLCPIFQSIVCLTAPAEELLCVSTSASATTTVKKMADYFSMDVKATRLNWYRDSKEWKPFHHDKAAFTPGCEQNCTVGASFGLTRDIVFQHCKNPGVVVSFPQPNGSMYTFGKDINVDWKHGVTQLPPEQQVGEGRISIICWGYVPEASLSD
eukprot:scaffold184659_cov50-Prasinocladus_malaysianus.AAC.1